MGQLSAIFRDSEDNGLLFWCPGCKSAHRIQHGEGSGPRWTWNGDVDKPVFSPSYLVTRDIWTPPVTPENLAEFRRNPWEQVKKPYVCHSFIGCNGAQPGQIIFLSDCTHELAGQTVDLPNWDSE